jgi:predicted ATPase
MISALAGLEEEMLQSGLGKLVVDELLYQRGRPPRSRYLFKHALIQDAAYQSLLKRTRQQYHQQVAKLLEDRFPEVASPQPELVAHHYTEANCPAQAIAYWHKAGVAAASKSANVEAIDQFRRGLALVEAAIGYARAGRARAGFANGAWSRPVRDQARQPPRPRPSLCAGMGALSAAR